MASAASKRSGVQAPAPLSAITIDPATGELVADHPFLPRDSIAAVLARCADAQKTWRALPLDRRLAVLGSLAAILRAKSDELAFAITREVGKPITQSRAEIAKCAATCDWYGEHGAASVANEPVVVDGEDAWISYAPIGVVLGIMPWNYPSWQPIRAIVPILVAGNGFVLKPAPNCVTTADLIAAAVEEAGAPPGLVAVLNIHHKDAAAVIADDRIAAVTLTGSVRAGSAVAALAGGAVKKTVLELGGSDPCIILADADLDAAAKAAAWARFQNAGQTCIAAKRIIVEQSVATAFTDRFIKEVKAFRLGDPTKEDTVIGPMARADLRDELADQVKRSIAAGAVELLPGGPFGERGTAYFRPVVLGNVRPGMAAFDEETFGPCAAIVEAADVEDAIRLANNSQFGLSSSIWTQDAHKARGIADRIEAGSVFINGVPRSDPRVPIGGVRKSGFGRELSYFGVREFTNAKLVWANT